MKRAQMYQGKPCKNGHSGIRYLKGGMCVGCACGKEPIKVKLVEKPPKPTAAEPKNIGGRPRKEKPVPIDVLSRFLTGKL